MKLGIQNKTFMALCAGPILLAMAASAGRNDDYPAPAPASSSDASAAMAPEASSTEDSYDSPTEIYPETPAPIIGDTPEPYTEATDGPINDLTSAPTDYYVETTDEGGMEEIPSSTTDGGEDEGEEAAPMDNPVDGASCSTYDEDVSVGCHIICAFLSSTCTGAHAPFSSSFLICTAVRIGILCFCLVQKNSQYGRRF